MSDLNFENFVLPLVYASTISLVLFAWVTHVLVCIKTGAWVLMLFGLFVPPIGWIHGVGYWFGLV